MEIHPIIRQVINRDCHVSWSNRKVIKHVVSKLKNGLFSFNSIPKKDRKDFMKQCICQHNKNFDLYKKVVTGKF